MPGFPYSAFERAAAPIYGATEDTIMRFRSRLHVFHREKVLGTGKDVSVGLGGRVAYTFDHMERWLCCMEFMELGMYATLACRLVIAEWGKRLGPIFRLARGTVGRGPGDGDIILLMPDVHFMSANWAPGRGYPGAPDITCCTLGELRGRIARATKPPRAGRVLTINLSSLLRRFYEQLPGFSMDEPRRAPAGAKSG